MAYGWSAMYGRDELLVAICRGHGKGGDERGMISREREE